MAITQAKKQEITDKISHALNDSATTVFVSFVGLGVEDNNTLRKELKMNHSNYFVTKKTLLKRVLDESSALGDQPDLGSGMLSIVYGDDIIAPARAIFEFSKQHKDSIFIMGGIFDGVFKSKEEMIDIATIPEMETLRAMFAKVIKSPSACFAVVLNQVAKKKA